MPADGHSAHGGASNAGSNSSRMRRELVACGRRLLARGLLMQTSGNLSIRLDEDIYITPSSLEYDRIDPDDIVVLGLDGSVRSCPKGRSPSSESPLHQLVYEARSDVSAIVHTHSGFATTLAILGTPIPAVHYMIATLETTEVAVAPYATYGTEALARSVRDAFAGPARAILLANHGMLAVGKTLEQAADAAECLERLAEFYYRARILGTPNILTSTQMAEVFEKYHAKVPPAASSSEESELHADAAGRREF